MSSLEVVRRPGKNGKTYLQIRGTILHPDGRTERIRRAPSSENIKLARQEAAALETRLLREAIHGKPRGAKPFAEAVASWLTAKDRAVPEQERIERILAHLPAGITCGEIDQEIVNELRGSMFRWKPSEATV